METFCYMEHMMDKCFSLPHGGYQSVPDQCKAQLHGIGLQEFTYICLYKVIKGFLGPTASQ